MFKFFKKSNALALSAVTIIFTFVPEIFFGQYKLLSHASVEANIVLNRILTFIIMFGISSLIYAVYLQLRKSVRIKGNNYTIQIEYGDLLQMHDCKKIINFDECFTTHVGGSPSDINPDSICGQYLKQNPIQEQEMQTLIEQAQLTPSRGKSKYKNKERYDSGKLVPKDDYLLMAFAKLDKDGLGNFFTYDEFLDCLSTLWKEIDKYYGQKDVCMPILGSGVTRMDGMSLTQQELLDIIIESYRLNAYKIKSPCKLHIVCKKRDNFSLNKIGKYL